MMGALSFLRKNLLVISLVVVIVALASFGAYRESTLGSSEPELALTAENVALFWTIGQTGLPAFITHQRDVSAELEVTEAYQFTVAAKDRPGSVQVVVVRTDYDGWLVVSAW